MTAEPLLAKSPRDPDHVHGAETLRGHTMLVLAAADELLRLRGEVSLRAAGLPGSWGDRLVRIVRAAAFIHDLGKANDHFQQMVRRRRTRQLVRHEALSLWLTWPGQALATWIQGATESAAEYELAVLAAAGHHRKFAALAIGDDAGCAVTLLLGHHDFAQLLRTGATRLDLGDPPQVANLRLEFTRRWSVADDLVRWEGAIADRLRSDETRRRLLAVAKALLLDADVAGSALAREGERTDWIPSQLGRRADAARLEMIVSKRLVGVSPRPFQEEVAASRAPITLVRAGCGSGKTAAAYLWAARQHGSRQLWVTYPTTGTTTEGYRDYLIDVGIEGRLEHGRAEVDLEMLGIIDGDGVRERDRLDAIRAWGAEVVTCTVDTILGLVQNQRKGLYAWAALADAAVVFDEIHAYDDRLFGALLRFLDALPGIPALLMTASLPAGRREALDDIVQRVHGGRLSVVDGPSALEELPRYVKVEVADPWPSVDACLERGGKVLWVVNTVRRCMATADASGGRALIYHSRFRYADRVERHRDVVAAFRGNDAALAVTTQVAEMSLDLSADLLVTDLAPIPSLIQRLGRLNRRATPEAPRSACPFVVTPFGGPPYGAEEYDEANRWLQVLGRRPLSQSDLIQAWQPAKTAVPCPVASAWLDGGFHTIPAALREENPGITVLCEDDAAMAATDARLAVASALPMGVPRDRDAWRSWRMVCGYPVAPREAIEYDRNRGGIWRV